MCDFNNISTLNRNIASYYSVFINGILDSLYLDVLRCDELTIKLNYCSLRSS